MTIHVTRFVEVQPTEALLFVPKGAGYVVEAYDRDPFDGSWTKAHDLDVANLESARACVPKWYWRVPVPGDVAKEAWVYAPEGSA